MRKILAILLAAVLLLSMTACAAEKEPEAYVPSEDIEVSLAFINDKATVVTRRLAQKDLKSVELACVYYNNGGLKLGEYELVECTFSTHDTLSIWSFDVPSGSVYMEATVSAVTYADGTKQTCPGVSTWGNSKNILNLQDYDKKLQEMKNLQGAAAESCPAATIFLGVVEEGRLKLEITAGEKAISSMVLYTLWYDEAGAPVDCGGVFVKNAEKITSGEMEANESGAYSIEAPEGAVKAKMVVQQVTYGDETVWKNDYFYEWAFVNYKVF